MGDGYAYEAVSCLPLVLCISDLYLTRIYLLHFAFRRNTLWILANITECSENCLLHFLKDSPFLLSWAILRGEPSFLLPETSSHPLVFRAFSLCSCNNVKYLQQTVPCLVWSFCRVYISLPLPHKYAQKRRKWKWDFHGNRPPLTVALHEIISFGFLCN